MSRTRTVALLLLAAGCGPKTTTTASAPNQAFAVAAASKAAQAAEVKPPPVVPPTPTADLPAATTAATKLLAALQAGAAEVSAVTPEFQKVLAGGDDGKAAWATEQHLRTFAGKVSPTAPTVAALPDGSVLAVTPPTSGSGRAVLKLIKAGDAWRAAWLHQAPAGPVPELATGPDLAQRLAVAAFVEPALANQPRLAEAALTAAGRSAVAPPLGNDPLGFSRGILSQKLANFRGTATGYTLTGTTGELLGANGEKRSFKLTVAPGGVVDFEPR